MPIIEKRNQHPLLHFNSEAWTDQALEPASNLIAASTN
jgi:hypothetical protein